MKQIVCQGTPHEIGFTYGSEAQLEIDRSVEFYAGLFLKQSKQSWPQVQETARVFETEIMTKWPRYYEEIQGIAAGAKRDILDIIALNVRTEIAFGLFSDGCTSLYWKTPHHAYLGQNWDWMEEQKPNIIILTIHQPSLSLPTIKMVTEAGIIGKIGLNAHGVGVCFNAIRVAGLDASRMPVHLGLRMALESSSTMEAVESIEEVGMASSAHMLIADENEAIGLEFTSATFGRISVDGKGRVVHSNHLLKEHKGAYEPLWLKDTLVRVQRMGELTEKFDLNEGEISMRNIQTLFEDESGFPYSICRAQMEKSTSATLFNIVMELKNGERKAIVRFGRPTEVEELVELTFD